MTSPAPVLKGETYLVEQAARDAAAYRPIEDRDDLRAAKGITLGLVIMAPLWVLVLALWWWL